MRRRRSRARSIATIRAFSWRTLSSTTVEWRATVASSQASRRVSWNCAQPSDAPDSLSSALRARLVGASCVRVLPRDDAALTGRLAMRPSLHCVQGQQYVIPPYATLRGRLMPLGLSLSLLAALSARNLFVRASSCQGVGIQQRGMERSGVCIQALASCSEQPRSTHSDGSRP